jgi:YD repeat-containing protein
MTDRIGNVQTINRNSAGNITTAVDALGRSLAFTYDSSNRIKTITSTPVGVSLSFQYDSDSMGNCYTGDLCTVTESDNSVWTYEYYNPSSNGGYHLLEYVLDPLGHTEEFDRYQQINLGNGDNHYRVVEQWLGSQQNDNAYSYSASGTNGVTTITDPVGNSTTYDWNQLLQTVTAVSGYLCFCRGDSLSYAFDTFGRPTSVVEGGNSTLITGLYGRDKIFTSPDGKTTYVSIAYPSITELTQYAITTSNGTANKVTQLSYYALGSPQQDLPQTVTEPSVDTPNASAVTTFTFSSAGLPTQISRTGYSNGNSKTHSVSATYDGKGRILTFTGPRTSVAQTTTLGYYPDTDADLNRRGQLESITDPLNHQTTFASAAAPNNSYSIYGGPLSTIDPNGVVTDLGYDLRGRLNQITLNGVPGDPTNLVTTLSHNAIGQIVTTTRALGNAISNSYDSTNRPIALTIVDGTGKQREQLALTYNNASQLVTEQAQLCGTPAASCSTWQTRMTQTFGYTPAVGTLATITDGAGGQTAFAWDQYGNNTGVTAGNSSYQYTTTNGFDPSHFLTSTRLSGSTAARVEQRPFRRFRLPDQAGFYLYGNHDPNVRPRWQCELEDRCKRRNDYHDVRRAKPSASASFHKAGPHRRNGDVDVRQHGVWSVWHRPPSIDDRSVRIDYVHLRATWPCCVDHSTDLRLSIQHDVYLRWEW